jgi:amino acid adenylation domain-containing protein
MIPHEHVGLQRIARWVPEARVACSFQSLLVVQAADHASEGDTLLGASEILGSSVGLLTYALTIECRPTSNSLNIQFHFDSNILHIIQVERLSRQFEHILRQLNNINMSERVKIESLELVPEDDIRVLSQWNSGNSDDQVDELMHQGFYRHLEVQPSSPAVEDYDSSLTYAELESLSNRLAHNLVAQFGIQTGHFVPLCAEKSTLTIVAALAILKIGGALTMLDPSLPIDRLKQMVNISKGCFILYTATTAHLRFNIPITPVILDRQFLDSLQTRDHFQVAVDPSDPACILFTSGSTGNPKGTVISHSAWSSGTKKATRFGGMEELRPLRTLQFAGMSFDICLFEIMPTLSVGGCVCVLPESERTSEGVVRAINRLRVNWAFMVPTFASLIETSYLPTLRTLHFAGEAAPPSLFSHFPKHVRLIQSYGPSECTPVTFVSTHLDPKVPTNVGRAIVGTGWIVDPLDHRRLVPIGAIGELLLAGPNVGGGYLGDSDKTAQSFIEPPPWTKYFPSVQQGRHMYLTGDLFRYDVNGTFIFLGRKDTQIKLRGQRMELGEIEHHLRLLVQEAKAIVAECITPAGQDRKLLVAFLCFSTADDAEADKGTLLPANTLDKIDLPAVVHRAAAFLPRYMVPTVFLPIQQLPFMRVSRKIDRHALRSLGSKLDATALRAYTIQQQDKKLPHSSAELEMRALFASVLQVDEHSIGTNDSFLMLGGDSIDAMRLVSLAGTTNVSLTVGQVLQNPILEDLAKLAVKNIDNEGLDIPIARWELLRKPHSADSIQAEAFVQCQLPPGIRIEDAYPCTPLQEGLFALSIARHGAYFAQHVFVAPPSVDSKSLMDAWQRLFDSLNIFRTRIIQLSTSELVQIVTREPLEWTTGDDLGAYLQRDQSVQFGLGQRLSRFALIQPAGSDSPVVVWSTHHSLYDGFSIQLIMAGLEAALDSGFCDLAAQNADFRQYIRYICNTDLDTSREYWKDQFSNGCFVQFPPVSRNETDRVERDLISGTIPYSQTLTNVTSSSVIRAAWALTLSRYTGSTDVIFGATVSGRDMAVPNISKIIGPVMSTVPVRVTIDYAKSVRHFVEKVQQQAVEMIAFQHFGLQKIAHSSSDAAAASRFQNLLVVQPSSFDREKANLITHHFADENDVQTHTYPMVIDCDIKDSSVEIKVLYNSHQIEPSQMHRILRLFGGFIQAIAQAAASDTTVSQLLRAHQPDIETLHAWNAKVPPAVEKCVHQCIPFKARASQLAIRSWDGDVTYGELDALSTKIAHHLVSLGVGPDVLVPMCFRKSLWAMVTTFGVLKAGGAPVFLDKEWSIDRLTNMIEFLDAELLLTSAQLFQDAKPKPRVTHIVEIDQIFVDAITSNAPLPEVQPYNLGFATFTSGSTGTPKCVLVEHRNLLTIEHLYVTVGEFRPNARVLQFASYVFDAMTKDFLATPLHGGTLYIPSEEDRMNNLVEYMRANQITQATLTPTIGSLFGPSDVPSLDVLILAGEKLTAENLATWAAAVHLNNGYGPSEACGRNTCRTGLTTDSDPGSIGHAIGCICWIADPDDHNLLVPIGAVGEILIEGPTVTRGYLKNPEKTADVFISPPEWIPADRRDSRNRLYKTGDLARLESNGSLTILGRKDSQVKLHGQRIELEEIERQFQVHLPPDIGIVVEMVSSKADGGTLLVGFLHDKTLNWGNCELQFMDPRLTALAELDIETVLNAVGQTLTSYMIPRVFMVISRIPLLPSAKTDRKILRELYANTDPSLLASHLISGSRRIQAPTSHRQERLRATISNVLRLDESFIGLNHNFLQLGGDSITAMRLVSAAKAENIGLTVTGILQSANLEELDCISIDIEEQQQEQVNPFELVECSDLSQLVAEAATQCKIAADLIEDIYPCTPLQEGKSQL